MTLELLARDHVNELWYVYHLSKATPCSRFLLLSYEHLTQDKEATLGRLASWFGVEVDDAMLQSIAEKTSKEAMATGYRFDPISFGDGEGQSKINLEPHTHSLSQSDMDVYNRMFIKRFSEVGIVSYSELVEELRSEEARR